MLTFGELVRRNSRNFPNFDAYVEEDRRINWQTFHQRTDALGRAFKALGIRHGDRVGITATDCIEVAEHFIACAKIGAVRVGLNYRLAPRELGALIDDSRPDVIVVQARHSAVIQQASGFAQRQAQLVGFGREHPFSHDYETIVADNHRSFDLDQTPHNELMICYTTGSTGLPKGAIYPHKELLSSINAIALSEGAQHDDVWLHAMPASGVPLVHLMRNLFHASKCVILGEWEPETALKLIEREQCTIGVLVPTMLSSLLDSGLLQDYDTRSLRQMEYGAAPLPAATVKQAMDALGCNFLQMYGSTELMGMAMMLYPSDHQKALAEDHGILASAGRPLPYVETKIIDDKGREVANGETGELIIRSEFVIPGYLNAPDKFEETVKNGWLYTGDMARQDEQGFIYLGDRASFRIKTGGYNVFPTEIENVIAEHPAVLDVAVFGLPDKKWGDRIHAVVTLYKDQNTNARELKSFCQGKIANFKIPKEIDIWPELPKGATGKILKRQIIEQVQNQ